MNIPDVCRKCDTRELSIVECKECFRSLMKQHVITSKGEQIEREWSNEEIEAYFLNQNEEGELDDKCKDR